MIDKYLRPVKEKYLLPIAKIISKYLSPNQISIVAFFMGLLSCILIIYNYLNIALGFWLLNRIIDGLDGTVARVSNRQTDWGGYLDIMLDFTIYALIPITMTFIINDNIFSYLSLSIMLASFYINSASWMYLSAVKEKREGKEDKSLLTSIPMPSGLIEGSETIVLYTLFFLFPNYLYLLFIIASVLTFIGIFQRIFWAFKNLR